MNPSDIQFAIVAETSIGAPVTAPDFQVLDVEQGSRPQYTSEQVTSAVIRSKRASRGSRKTNYQVTEGFRTDLVANAAIDLIIESGMSGKFNAGVAKAGNTDSTYMVEKRMSHNDATFYHRFHGCMGTGYTVSSENGSATSIEANVLGLDRTTATAAIASSTYAQAADQDEVFLIGADTIVNVNGLDLDVRSASITVEHNREVVQKLGSNTGFKIGTEGNRTVRFSISVYREDLSLDTLFAKSDASVPVSVNFGAYTFASALVQFATPSDAAEGSSEIVTLEGVARYDAASDTDLTVTKN